MMLPLLRKLHPSQYHFSMTLIMVLSVGTNDGMRSLNCWPRTYRALSRMQGCGVSSYIFIFSHSIFLNLKEHPLVGLLC